LCLIAAIHAFAQAPASMKESIEKQRASAAIQRETIRKQMENQIETPTAVDVPDCAALTEETVSPLIEHAAKSNQLEPKLVRAVVAAESLFHPCAVSRKGAQGLMQLMPSTAEQFGVANVFDPQQNLEGGARYLKQLIDKYKGNLAQALGAYNAGPAAVDQAGGVPNFPETQAYVKAILDKLAPRP
jgi:soluble lytic murein transglycosylase-like protein